MPVANAIWTEFYIENSYTDLDTCELYGKVSMNGDNFLAIVMPPELPLGHQIQVIGIHSSLETAKQAVETYWSTRPTAN